MIQEMMLGEKYSKEYLDNNEYREFHSTIKRIIEKEKDYNMDCVYWNIEQIEGFLKSLKSKTPNVISKVLAFTRKYVGYICQENNLLVPEFKLDNGKLQELVDYEGLLSTVISPSEYKLIKKQFINNVRDKVIFILSWNCLTSKEIQGLKEDDVEFKIAKNTGLEVAFLTISDTKILKIEDPSEVEDIKKCMKEKKFYRDSMTGKGGDMYYKPSKYLIKPVQVGRTKKEDYISSPGITLQKAMLTQKVICPNINISELTVESIRRSKLIYLLAPKNEKYFDRNFIKMIYGLEGSDSSLHWLKKISQLKYGN